MGLRKTAATEPLREVVERENGRDTHGLIAQLRSGDAEQRRWAARDLAGCGEAAGVMGERLVADTDPRVRDALLTSLSATPGEATVNALLPLLRSEDAVLRNGAIEALAEMPQVITPFPGGVIPQNRFDPVAAKLLQFYPAPTTPGDNILRNYTRQAYTPTNWDQFTQRIDFNENAKSFWFGRFGWNDEYTSTASLFANQNEQYALKAYQAMISNIRTFTPTMVNEFRFGFNQLNSDATTSSAYVRNVTAELGMRDIYNTSPAAWGIPSVSLANGLSGFGDRSEEHHV